MSEVQRFVAVELSDTELDTVAGGLSIMIGDANGLAQSATNDYFKKSFSIAQKTYAGPDGSGTVFAANLEEIFSSAGQSIVIS